MWFIHHLLRGGDEIGRIFLHKGTHIKTDNALQIGEGLYDNLPHIEISVLEKLLYGNLFAVLGFDLKLGSEGITSPETSAVRSAERHEAEQTEGSLR